MRIIISAYDKHDNFLGRCTVGELSKYYSPEFVVEYVVQAGKAAWLLSDHTIGGKRIYKLVYKMYNKHTKLRHIIGESTINKFGVYRHKFNVKLIKEKFTGEIESPWFRIRR